MQHILPEAVISSIRDSYQRGVAIAEKGYIYAQEDEDVVTGALGQALLAEDQVITVDGSVYIWRTIYQKFRGRGKNATEKLLGADGIFQVEIRDGQQDILLRKGLLFQAKNRWQGQDKKLKSQAGALATPPEIGIVIDYSNNGFHSCSAIAAFNADGNRRKLPDNELESLSVTLGDKFLYCRAGIENVFYDPISKTLYLPPGFKPIKKLAYRHVVTTKVIQVVQRQNETPQDDSGTPWRRRGRKLL